mmetsp:Transcript_36769/g.76788  ORF Transcript_36769/g.76788 Transcript_36769/m.76788 type:complete len:100 (+) Transcript_36769:1388-1687(+)
MSHPNLLANSLSLMSSICQAFHNMYEIMEGNSRSQKTPSANEANFSLAWLDVSQGKAGFQSRYEKSGFIFEQDRGMKIEITAMTKSRFRVSTTKCIPAS